MRNYRYVAGVVGGVVAAAMTAACSGGDTGAATDIGVSQEALDHGGHQHNGVRSLPNNFPFRNATGFSASYSTQGKVDLTGGFFQNLGTNGRRCVSCHEADQGWTVTPAGVREKFEETGGRDPIFRTNDGSNSPTADVSTVKARRAAYNMLLTKGLIRVGIGVPASADFELVAVDDPYHHANASDLSLFRRPLPAANLKFLSTVMWDGRETFSGQTIHFDLSDQSNGATLGHAAGATPLTNAQRDEIVAFETSLFTSQIWDDRAHSLSAHGAKGGSENLSTFDFYIGMNDLFGDSHTGAAFNPEVFSLYNAWSQQDDGDHDADDARASIARGEKLFNSKPIAISGVSGINDEAAFGNPSVVNGTCTSCHDTPNSGNHSVSAPLNIGLTDASRRTPDLPLYTFRSKVTGATVQTTDPGRALISGQFKHIGRFKGPILRGLAARAPYFHNGSAADLSEVIDFYESRFAIGFTSGERRDITHFLQSL